MLDAEQYMVATYDPPALNGLMGHVMASKIRQVLSDIWPELKQRFYAMPDAELIELVSRFPTAKRK